jgi:hypothetical protein
MALEIARYGIGLLRCFASSPELFAKPCTKWVSRFLSHGLPCFLFRAIAAGNSIITRPWVDLEIPGTMQDNPIAFDRLKRQDTFQRQHAISLKLPIGIPMPGKSRTAAPSHPRA